MLFESICQRQFFKFLAPAADSHCLILRDCFLVCVFYNVTVLFCITVSFTRALEECWIAGACHENALRRLKDIMVLRYGHDEAGSDNHDDLEDAAKITE